MTKPHDSSFDEHEVIHELKHYLPAQSPLKDFIHHNTLHGFQNLKFHDGTSRASEIFGYSVSLSIDEYRDLYKSGRIREDILEKVIIERNGTALMKEWKEAAVSGQYGELTPPRIGSLRANWKRHYKIDLDSLVHPLLFRILCSYLDQGISIWSFPVWNEYFLTSIREMERISFTSFFKTDWPRRLLLKSECKIEALLDILVGDKSLYKQYLFDQQFAHQGWSGMVSTVEDVPQTLLDRKQITLQELIIFELLLEIDALDFRFGKNWQPLSKRLTEKPIDLFAEVPKLELYEVRQIWQEAFEWSYYDEALSGLITKKHEENKVNYASFQAVFCIDDRECSFRRYIEKMDPDCETFAAPGFFSVEFFYQPEGGKFYTKLCPWPVTPKHLIKQVESKSERKKDVHFSKHAHSFFGGALVAHTIGFWSAVRLFFNIFKPTMGPAATYSFRHMDKFSKLTIENTHPDDKENGLQIGYTFEEMANRAEGLLKSIGLVKDFAPIVYIIGHGSSSVNNPHFAAYDCGACSGRAGSVNSRVMCHILNHPEVRKILRIRRIIIPPETQFVGGLHDTTRDEIIFFDEGTLSTGNQKRHQINYKSFEKALDLNAKERSRRFVSINTRQQPKTIHKKIKIRSVSLFEPRPELNHATNALCVVGRRSLTSHLFLDRRCFMNSFDYRVDPEGKYLLNILNAVAPVCGGINLEYFFSRVDNQKLGAGTKLPHNVMGLFGVANGADGDLRPGLPSQMIEVHDPVRLLVIVEHFPHVVLKTIQTSAATYEWFINEWIHLVVINPETQELFRFKDGAFFLYKPLRQAIETVSDITPLIEENIDNLPVYVLD
ncbi:MAG TPA: YbcC family protein [Candidatus Wunengus sp. YC63]|uniref:YbcC family protein n=2 Tax=unclassified Candidatus Wunengus TaxID=3367695 RepID=UPI00402736A6